jgi:hypothetical protein
MNVVVAVPEEHDFNKATNGYHIGVVVDGIVVAGISPV